MHDFRKKIGIHLKYLIKIQNIKVKKNLLVKIQQEKKRKPLHQKSYKKLNETKSDERKNNAL